MQKSVKQKYVGLLKGIRGVLLGLGYIGVLVAFLGLSDHFDWLVLLFSLSKFCSYVYMLDSHNVVPNCLIFF